MRGYYASDVLLTISVVGSMSGTVYAIGCYVCFRVSGLHDRKGYNGWLVAYMVTLIVSLVGFGYALYECYTALQTPVVERSLEVCVQSTVTGSGVGKQGGTPLVELKALSRIP